MHSKLLCLRPRLWEQHYFAQVRAATALLSTPWHGCGKHIILEQQQHVPMVSPNSTGMRLAHSQVVCSVAAVSLSTASAPLAAMPMPHGTQSSPVYTCMCVCYLPPASICLLVCPACCLCPACFLRLATHEPPCKLQLEGLDLLNCLITPLFFASTLSRWPRSFLSSVYCMVLAIKGYQMALLLLPAARKYRAHAKSRCADMLGRACGPAGGNGCSKTRKLSSCWQRGQLHVKLGVLHPMPAQRSTLRHVQTCSRNPARTCLRSCMVRMGHERLFGKAARGFCAGSGDSCRTTWLCWGAGPAQPSMAQHMQAHSPARPSTPQRMQKACS
mgnify:CR=1 FL=1